MPNGILEETERLRKDPKDWGGNKHINNTGA